MSNFIQISSEQFEKYRVAYPRALESFPEVLQQTFIGQLQAILLLTGFCFEYDLFKYPEGLPGEFLKQAIARMLGEGFGLMGCLSYGALQPAYHHARVSMELRAVIAHVFADPAKTEERIKKFFAFEDLFRFNFHSELREKRDAETISQEEYQKRNFLSDQRFAEFETKVPEWKKLWEPKKGELSKVKHWQYGASIENLFESIGDDGVFWGQYEKACHNTHLSPLTYKTTGRFLIGFPRKGEKPDLIKINYPIGWMILSIQSTFIDLEKRIQIGILKEMFSFNPTL